MEYRFFVLGKPEPWSKDQSPRGRLYLPPKVKAWQESIRWRAKQTMGPKGMKLQGPLSLMLTFYIENLPGQVPDNMAYPCRAGIYADADLTNLEKAVEDALQSMIFVNDRWVVAKQGMMIFASPEQKEGVQIRVWEIET